MKKEYFRIVENPELESEEDKIRLIPVHWSVLPQDFMDEFPEVIYSVSVIDPEEGLSKKSMAYLIKTTESESGIHYPSETDPEIIYIFNHDLPN